MENKLIFQLPRENIWQKSQMITFDDIMQQSGLDEFSDLVEAEHNASIQAQGNLLKPTMLVNAASAWGRDNYKGTIALSSCRF